MDKIEWSDKFSVGIEAMDAQHHNLVNLINKLIGAPDLETNSSLVPEMLGGMIEYATTHFEDEERLMQEHGYPDYDGQREQHGEFITKTAEFCAEGALELDKLPQSILIYLREWWITHILIDDMKYKGFFKDKDLSS